ncbi:DUF192 domain-containing protein [Nitrincola alkalilacustris]|uniref:DUF192 domain-containing protein n=1 Tax=Nitrincola alkalilacustris TaxID=1571224 RepID=UPI00124E9D94|nr:DUF192 domain-containing protein [Nitrincola alkalilacustris]
MPLRTCLKSTALLIGISLSALALGDATYLSNTPRLIKSQQLQAVEFERVKLQVGEHLLDTEIAETAAQKTQGLMWRESLPEDSAMLFILDDRQQQCFWMRNTLIPLTLAYIDRNGRIIEFFDMQPLSDETHCATKPAQFGLEVNQGWFARKGIVPGDRIRLIEDQQPD